MNHVDMPCQMNIFAYTNEFALLLTPHQKKIPRTTIICDLTQLILFLFPP